MWPGCCGSWGSETAPRPWSRRTTSGSSGRGTPTPRRSCCSPGPSRAAHPQHLGCAHVLAPLERGCRAVTAPATILVARHADAEYETQHWADEGGSLTQQGRDQAVALGKALVRREVAHVW